MQFRVLVQLFALGSVLFFEGVRIYVGLFFRFGCFFVFRPGQ